MQGAEIQAVGVYVPEKRVSNDDLSQTLDTSDEWIFSHTGIKNRHIADESEAASDLGAEAAMEALRKAGVSPSEIDMIIVTTSTPDYNGFPATACIIQDKIGAVNAGAFDLLAACTGFIYGLEVGRSMVECGSVRRVLVVGTEVMSRVINWKDRSTCVLFGDGAGAILLGPSSGHSRIYTTILRSEGAGAEYLMRKVGGVRHPYTNGRTNLDELHILMDGRKVYNFAVRVNTEIISELLERNDIEISDLRYIVPHQANVRIIQAAAKRLEIPMERFFVNIAEYANTSSASIPIALHELVRNNRLAKGDLIMILGFGAGLTYGGTIFRW